MRKRLKRKAKNIRCLFGECHRTRTPTEEPLSFQRLPSSLWCFTPLQSCLLLVIIVSFSGSGRCVTGACRPGLGNLDTPFRGSSRNVSIYLLSPPSFVSHAKNLYRPIPTQNTTPATAVANATAMNSAQGINIPNIPMLVSVAKTPPAGVKPPYMTDCKIAASEPVVSSEHIRFKFHCLRRNHGVRGQDDKPAATPTGPKPRPRMIMTTMLKVIIHARKTASISIGFG